MAGRTRVLIAVLLLAGASVAPPAQARPYRHSYHHDRRHGGGAAAAAIIGGLVGLGLGAALASQPPGYYPPYGYPPPPPTAYYGNGYGYYPYP